MKDDDIYGKNQVDNEFYKSSDYDKFGIKKIFHSVLGGREFFQPVIIGEYHTGDREGDMIVRGNGNITGLSNGIIIMHGTNPRIYVYDINREKIWKNVEITVHVMRISEIDSISSQGVGIAARSIHELQSNSFNKVPTYYLKYTYDGRFFFIREDLHPDGIVYQPNSQNNDFPFIKNKWMGIKFIVRTTSLNGARLQGYLDMNCDNNWVKIRDYTDLGFWTTPESFPIQDGTSVFIRNDHVNDFRIRNFSIREIR